MCPLACCWCLSVSYSLRRIILSPPRDSIAGKGVGGGQVCRAGESRTVPQSPGQQTGGDSRCRDRQDSWGLVRSTRGAWKGGWDRKEACPSWATCDREMEWAVWKSSRYAAGVGWTRRGRRRPLAGTVLCAGRILHGEAPARWGKPACDFLGRNTALLTLPRASTLPGQASRPLVKAA